jgi:RNA polymerase primary sigma factor
MSYSYKRPPASKIRISRKDELSLFRQYRQGKPDLRNFLVESYFYVIIYVLLKIGVKNRFTHSLFDDLINEGVLGLIKAVQTYHPDREASFFYYATPVVRGYIYNALKNKEATIRIPGNIYKDVREIKKKIKELLRSIGHGISTEEIAQKLNLSKKDVEKLALVFRKTISMDQKSGGDSPDERTRHDTLSVEDNPSQLDLVIQKDRMERISKAMECLNKREKEVLILRFGLLGRGREMTLQESGDYLGLSRERIRQIEAKALIKMKKANAHISIEDIF